MENNLDSFSWLSITENSTDDWVDFSVNTNPFGVPKAVIENISKIGSVVQFYPDPMCTTLTTLLSNKYNAAADTILCGNGADDLLYRLVFAMKPKKALIIEPTFEEYGRALRVVGCKINHHKLSSKTGFEIDSKVLLDIHADLDMVFLCNPNNPTGRLANPYVIEQLIRKCQQEKVMLVIDECFMEFLPEWQRYSVKQQAALSQNLIVIDAFTKTYSLAGFRLGYCITGNSSLLANMKSQGQDFGVSVPAQFAGICALMDKDYLHKTHLFLKEEREWLYSQLCALNINVIPSQTNYFLFQSEYPNVREMLLTKQIKVRDCSQFYGLGPTYCRIAVKQHNENVKFIKAMRDLVG